MALIISDKVISPPTTRSAFRDLTLYCDIFLKKPVVIESNDPDPFYRWLRPMGGMDFVQDFVRPGSEIGLRIDSKPAPLTIVADRIVAENLHWLIVRLKYGG